MAEKNANSDYYNEPVVADEMQKAVSFELEHRSLRLWYVLNSIAMIFTMFIFVGTEDPAWTIPPSIQILLLAQYGIMYFCLSLYNIRAADKGVLDSFSPFQKRQQRVNAASRLCKFIYSDKSNNIIFFRKE